MAKVLLNDDAKYVITDIEKSYHSQYGKIASEEFTKERAVSNTGNIFSCFDAGFIDNYEKLTRQAQIISLKEIGVVIAETGINKDSIVLEAGSGSGAFGSFMAHICKKVYSYDIRDDHQKTAKANAEMLQLKNIVFKIADVRDGVTETDLDLVLLDMPDPWVALSKVSLAIKRGGWLVVYSPTIPQVMDTVDMINEQCRETLFFVKTMETIQRGWDISGRKVRPSSSYINHTGFLTFIRRI